MQKTDCCAVAALTWFSHKAKTMNNRVGGWGCAFTKLSGGGVPGNSPRMRRGRRFSEFAERKALPRAPPSSTASIRAEATAIFDLELPARRRRAPQICCSAAPARTATAVLVFFSFSAAGPAVLLACRLVSGPLLAAVAALETTASHSTTLQPRAAF